MDNPERQLQFVFAMRRRGVTDARVLGALEAIPREDFMDGIFRERAYDDVPLPIGCGQTVSAPSIVGLMSQALDVPARAKVLEIGTGSGYQAAILSKLSRRVYTVERHRDLAREARLRFDALGLSNVVALHADGTRGLAEQAPFDRIIVTAAAEDVPSPLLEQLSPNGVLVMPTGDGDHIQKLIKVVKLPHGLEYKELADVRFVPLVEGLPSHG